MYVGVTRLGVDHVPPSRPAGVGNTLAWALRAAAEERFGRVGSAVRDASSPDRSEGL